MLTCGLTMDKRNAEPVLKYFPLASKEELYPSTVYGNGSQMPPIFSKLCKTPQRNAWENIGWIGKEWGAIPQEQIHYVRDVENWKRQCYKKVLLHILVYTSGLKD